MSVVAESVVVVVVGPPLARQTSSLRHLTPQRQGPISAGKSTFCLRNLLNKISPPPNCLLCQRRAAPQTLSSRTEASSVKSPRPLLSSTSRACSLAKITMEPPVHYRPDSTPSPAFPISPDLAPIFHGHGGRNCGNSATGSQWSHLGWSHLWTTPWGDFAACNPANELVATIGQPYTGFLQKCWH